MLTRAAAAVLVLTLTGPSVVAAACELTCALASHHHGATSSAEASCHGHGSSTQGAGVTASSSTPCHESGDLPSAVMDAAVIAIAVHSVLPQTIALVRPVDYETIARVPQRATSVDPPPAYRPLRV